MKIHESLTLSPSLEFGQTIAKLKQSGEKIISLGLGEPEFPTPENISEAAFKAIKEGYTRYSSPLGIVPLREQIALKLQKENGISAGLGEIMVVPGAKNALFLALAAVLQQGDEIINFSPCYVSNIPLIYLAEPQAVIRTCEMNKADFSIDVEYFKSLISPSTKAVLLNYPNNPTGTILEPDTVEEIVRICVENNIYIISDEIYEPVYYGALTFTSPASIEGGDDFVITINGFSKSYSMTGWRIGYIHTKNQELFKVMLKIHQQLNTNTPVFTQYAALEGLNNNQHTLESFKSDLRQRADYAFSVLNERDKLSLVRPTGGIFGFVNISKTGLNSEAFAIKLLKAQKIAILAGKSFGEHFDDHCRVSFVCANEEFKEGIDKIAEFANTEI